MAQRDPRESEVKIEQAQLHVEEAEEDVEGARPEVEEPQPALEKAQKEERSLRSKFKDHHFRRMLTKTIFLGLVFFASGVCSAQIGPTFLDLQIITRTNVQQASSFFTAASVGFVVGSLAGGVVYDLYSKHLLLILSMFGLAAVTTATPYCEAYGLMVAVCFLRNMFMGSVDPAANSEVIRMWGADGSTAMHAIHFFFAFGGIIAPLFTEPFLAPRADTDDSKVTLVLGSNSDFTGDPLPSYDKVNGTGPLGLESSDGTSELGLLENEQGTGDWSTNLTEFSGKKAFQAFLPENSASTNESVIQLPALKAEKSSPTLENLMTDLNRTTVDKHLPPVTIQYNPNNTDSPEHLLQLYTNFDLSNNTGTDSDAFQSTDVHHAFLIAGLITLLSAVLLFLDYLPKCKERLAKLRNRRKNTKQENKDDEKNKTPKQEELSRKLKLFLLAWICAFFMMYAACEDTFINYLTTFAVMQFSWSKGDGARLNSVFWGCFAASRFVCIWVSRVVKSVQLLTFCCLLMLLSFTGFLLASLFTLHPAVWVFTATTGVAMSAVFPAGLSWMEAELLPVTGRTNSAIALAATAVLAINQQVLGHMFESRGAIWLAYVLLGEAAACLLTFLLLLLFARTRLKKIRRKAPSHQHVISIDVPEAGAQLVPLMTL